MSEPIDKLKQAAGLVHKPVTLEQGLEALKPKIVAACKRIDPDRLIRLALGEMRRIPALQNDPAGVMACVLLASNLNLEFGVFGQCYMVPFRGKATFITGWQGWSDLVSRSGRASVWTGAVREGDEFDCSLGSKPFLKHKPDFDGDEDRKLLYTYAVGRQNGVDTPIIDVWGESKLRKHLKRYNRVGDRHYALTDAHNWEMYGRKIPLLQVVKYLPKSVEARVAAQLDRAVDEGTQRLTIEQAGAIMEGEYVADGSTEQVEVGNDERAKDIAKLLSLSDSELGGLLKKHGGDWDRVVAELEPRLDS